MGWFLNFSLIFEKFSQTNQALILGERRDSNPRVMESQSIALPLGYARHITYYTIFLRY